MCSIYGWRSFISAFSLSVSLSLVESLCTSTQTHIPKMIKQSSSKKNENKVMNWIETRCCGRWCVSGRRECYEWNMLLVTGYELILKCFSISILVVARFFHTFFCCCCCCCLLYSCTRAVVQAIFEMSTVVWFVWVRMWIGRKQYYRIFNWPQLLSHKIRFEREFFCDFCIR